MKFIITLGFIVKLIAADITPIETDLTSFSNGNPFSVCNNSKYNEHPLRQKVSQKFGYTLYEECRPEVLYFWASDKRLSKFQKMFEQGKWNHLFNSPLHTVMWPAQTFYYGPNPIRVKLRQGVFFKSNFRDGCVVSGKISLAKQRELDNTVYYSMKVVPGLGETYEFLICSSAVIESVSFGQVKHYDEIIKDIIWSSDPSIDDDDKPSYIRGPRSIRAIQINLQRTPFIYSHDFGRRVRQVIDEKDVSYDVLIRHLQSTRSILNSDDSFIYTRPNIDKNRHFVFNVPTYFSRR